MALKAKVKSSLWEICPSLEWLEQAVKPVVVEFLAARGLTLSPSKTAFRPVVTTLKSLVAPNEITRSGRIPNQECALFHCKLSHYPITSLFTCLFFHTMPFMRTTRDATLAIG